MFEKWIEKININGIEKEVEVRWDGIFGRYCRIISRVGLEIDKQEDFSEKIDEECIFCHPEKIASFDERFEKKKFENEYAFLFPNINPYSSYSSVCAFKKHYIKLNEFSPKLIQGNLELAIEYMNKVLEMDGNMKYASINWNYLMPAGASILHPHMQVVIDKFPTSYMKKILKNKKFYDYIGEEMRSNRYVGKIGSANIFIPFAPFGFNEIFAFLDGDIENALESISKIISYVLLYYNSIRRNSFNLAIYYSIEKEFPLHLRMITRQNMIKYYRNDAMFFERLHMETILEKKPEEIAKELKDFLKSQL